MKEEHIKFIDNIANKKNRSFNYTLNEIIGEYIEQKNENRNDTKK